MRRSIAVGLFAALVAVLAWWWWRRAPHSHRVEPGAGSRPLAGELAAAGSAAIARTASPLAPGARDPDPAGHRRLEGLVLDESDRPVPGATIQVASDPPRRVVADTDGSFAIDGLLDQAYVVHAWHLTRYADPVVVMVRATTEPLVIHLARGNTVVVLVKDAATEAPIAGATVDDRHYLVTTDGSGRAEMIGLWPQFNAFEVRAPGYAPTLLAFIVVDDPDARVEKVVHLERGAAVAGHVVDHDGRPVAGAVVTVAGELVAERVEADAQGGFAVPRLAAGSYTATAIVAGLAPGRLAFTLDGAARTDLVVRVEAGANLGGVVVDAAGLPIVGAVIEVHAGELDPVRRVLSGADGRFALTGMERVAHVVAATYAGAASAAVEVELTAGDRTDLRLVLEPTDITGVVVDAAGAPVAEARVTALPATDPALSSSGHDVADAAGRFQLEGLLPGSYRVEATWPEAPRNNLYLHGEVATVAAGTHDVRLTLPEAGTITGVVTRDGAPVRAYALALSDQDFAWSDPQAVRATDGRFRRAALPPGTWQLRVVGDGFIPVTLDAVVVRAGAITDVGTIAVEEGATVRGRVIDAAGAPVAAAQVVIAEELLLLRDSFVTSDDPRAAATRGIHLATTGADGTFALTGIARARGDRPLRAAAVHPRLGISRAAAVTVPSDGVTITLEAPGAVDGTLVGPRSAGPLLIDLVGTAAGGYDVGAVTTDRSFQVPMLSPGTYAVTVTAMRPTPKRTPPVQVVVTAGQTAPLTIDLATLAPLD